jgi:hypothetical protein
MDAAVNRRNTLHYDRALLNYWNRAKEKPMARWYLFSYGAKIEFLGKCKAITVQA